MNTANTSRIVCRQNGSDNYISDYHFTCHEGTLVITQSTSGFLSSRSDFKYDLDDDGMDNTEYFAAIDGIEAMVMALVEKNCVGYRSGQIPPECVADIIDSAIQAAANNL